MGNLIWKAKQLVRKIFPLAVIGLIIYGGYNMVRRGYFRNGVGPAFTRVLHQVPYFGSRFKHYNDYSYAYSAPRSYGHRRGHSRHSHRRHRRRHHRR